MGGPRLQPSPSRVGRYHCLGSVPRLLRAGLLQALEAGVIRVDEGATEGKNKAYVKRRCLLRPYEACLASSNLFCFMPFQNWAVGPEPLRRRQAHGMSSQQK